jgi:hypothetical protein
MRICGSVTGAGPEHVRCADAGDGQQDVGPKIEETYPRGRRCLRRKYRAAGGHNSLTLRMQGFLLTEIPWQKPWNPIAEISEFPFQQSEKTVSPRLRNFPGDNDEGAAVTTSNLGVRGSGDNQVIAVGCCAKVCQKSMWTGVLVGPAGTGWRILESRL